MKTLRTRKDFQQIFTTGHVMHYDWMVVYFFYPRFPKTATESLLAGV